MRTAATAVESSGRDVAKARNEAPTKDSPRPDSVAMPSAAMTMNGAATRMTMAAAPNLRKSGRRSCHIEVFGGDSSMDDTDSAWLV